MELHEFTIFSELPFELREKIWLAFLGGIETRRAFIFHVDNRKPASSIQRLQLLPSLLLPGEWAYRGLTFENGFIDLIAGMQPLLALLATSREARSAVLHHSPDRLPFGTVLLNDVKSRRCHDCDEDNNNCNDKYEDDDDDNNNNNNNRLSWSEREEAGLLGSSDSDTETMRRVCRIARLREPSRPAEPTRYWLPFRAERDIIIVGVHDPGEERKIADCMIRERATKLGDDESGQEGGKGDKARGYDGYDGAATGKTPLPRFLESVQNLAFLAGDCQRGRHDGVDIPRYYSQARFPRPRKASGPPPTCCCGRESCPTCSVDPLPYFLATCCPRLKTFSFAIINKGSWPQNFCLGHLPYNFELVPACGCQSGGEHSWPKVQLINRSGNWCVWYPEKQQECPFPALPSLVHIREKWHPRWPYYDSLRHIEFRILRCIEGASGQDATEDGLESWRKDSHGMPERIFAGMID